MNHTRLLNGTGWTLLFTGCIYPIGGFSGISPENAAIVLSFICAMSSVPLLWLGGYNFDHRKRSTSPDQ